MSDICIIRDYIPGAIGRVAELNGRYYHDNWGFGLFFEAMVATDLSAFLQRYDPRRDGFWTASVKGRVEAHISIDGLNSDTKGAHLRYFIVSDDLRGTGIGRALITRAISFCREARHKKVYLWTFAGLDSARHLYEAAGFRLVESQMGSRWGTEVTEQRFELHLS
ncbi:MAG TPA: GNAT family N-acetyltransferase [Smithellaceae bacterium]|nr:GNAT family N-acetyltransferase [Smithellaceae bacterium]